MAARPAPRPGKALVRKREAFSGATIRAYQTRVDGGYEDLNQSITHVVVSGVLPPNLQGKGWDYVNRWAPKFGAWNEFYVESNGVFIPDTTYDETRTFHRELLRFGAAMKAALGKPPPPLPPIASDVPSEKPQEATIITYVPWALGVLALFGVGYAIRSVIAPPARSAS